MKHQNLKSGSIWMDNERYAQIRGLDIRGNLNKFEVYELANQFREKSVTV